MFYFKAPDTRVLTPLEDAEIVSECPICGKYFAFRELWDLLADEPEFTIWDSTALCDECGKRAGAIRKALTNAGIPEGTADNTTLIADIIKATSTN